MKFTCNHCWHIAPMQHTAMNHRDDICCHCGTGRCVYLTRDQYGPNLGHGHFAGLGIHRTDGIEEAPMQTFYVRVEDLHATKDTIDAPESEMREVHILDCKPGEIRPGGHAGEEQE